MQALDINSTMKNAEKVGGSSATSKLVKAWESKGAKNAAKASGLTLMALSLSACGGSSDSTPAATDTTTISLTNAGGVFGMTGSVAGVTLPSSEAATLYFNDAADDSYALTLDADTIGSGKVKFEFADANDVLVLDADTDLGSVTEIEVAAGTVDFTQLAEDAFNATSLTLNSGARMTVQQVGLMDLIKGTGELVVVVSNDTEISTAISALEHITSALPTSISGRNITFEASEDAGSAVTSSVLASANAELSAMTGMPQLLTASATDELVGTSGSDVFTGNQVTFNNTDSIDGGAGTDTLAITNTAAGTYAPGLLSNVEVIQMTSAAASSIDLIVATGVEKVISLNSTAGDTFSNLQTLADIEINGSSDAVTVTYANALMSGSADSVNLALMGGADTGLVTIEGATATNVVETVNVSVSGASAIAVDGIVSNSVAIGTLDISGSTDLTLGTGTAFASGDVLAVNIDAADMTGDLTVYADGANTNASITGGAGDDTIYLDGVDTFYAADNGNASSNVVTSIVGGAGDDTLVIDGSLVASQLVTTTADTADNVLSGVETLSHVSAGNSGSTGTADVTVDASVSADLENVIMSLTNSTSSGSSANVYVGEVTNITDQDISVIGAKGSHATAEVEMEVTVYDGSAVDTSAAVTAAGDFKILTFNDASDDADTTAVDEAGGVEAVSLSSGATDLAIDTLVAAKAYGLTLAGAKDVTISAANLGGTNVSNEATTDDVVTVNAAALTGDLDFTKSEAGVYSVTGGAGTNDIRLGALGHETTVTGGAGTDTVYVLDESSASDVDITTDAAVEALVIDTTTSGADTFDLLGVNDATTVKITDAQQAAGFGVTVANVGAHEVEIVTAEATSAAANATNDTNFASAATIVLGKATGAANTYVKLSGDAEGASSASSYDGVIETTGKLTLDSQIQTSAGVYLDTNVELKGAVTELVLTGGGAQTSTVNATVDLKEVGSDVALTSLDASSFVGNITATDDSLFAAATSITLGSSDNTLTMNTDGLARDASVITDTGGDDTLVFTAAVQGSSDTLSLRPEMTGVETVAIQTTNNSTNDHANGLVSLNLVDTSGVTTITTNGHGANDVSVTNAGAVTSLVLGGGADTDADDVTLDAATDLVVENSEQVGKTAAGNLTVDSATSLVLEHGHASAIAFATLSADAATSIEIGGGLDGAGTDSIAVTTFEADEVTSLTLDASEGTILLDNFTADKLATITITGDNAVTLGEDASGTDGTVATVALASVAAGAATAAVNLSGTMEYAVDATIVTGSGDDNVDLGSSVAAGVTVSTGVGDDTITMASGSVRALDGGADADDGGNDTLVITGTNNTGAGVVNLSATGDQVTTFNGVPEEVVQTGFESVDLSGLTSSGSYGFAITANSEGSTIVATAQNDTITGGAGNDTITGGDGADVIALGGGTDTLVIASSASDVTISGSTHVLTQIDTVSEAIDGTKIDLTGLLATSGGGALTVARVSDVAGSITNGTSTATITNGVVTGYTTGDGSEAGAAASTVSDTLEEVLDLLDGGTAGNVTAFTFGSDSYLQVENGAVDTLIKFEGVTIDTLTLSSEVATITIA